MATGLDQQGALMDRFAKTKPDYAAHAEIASAIATQQREDDLAGQKSGSKESMTLASAAATKDAQDAKTDAAERAAKQQAADAIFLDLLRQIEEIDRKIEFHNEQVELLTQTMGDLESGRIDIGEALGQAHVQRAIEEWEKRNPGQEFDPTADNADDVLLGILTEQKANDQGTIKGLTKDREGLVREAEANNDLYRTNPELAIQQAIERSSDSYSAAETFNAETEHEAIKGQVWEGQDGHSDDTASSIDALEDEDAFAGFGLGPVDSLEASTGELTNEFTVASAEQSEPTTPAVEIDPVLESGLKV